MKRLFLLLFALALCFVPLFVRAQAQEERHEIIVTATRLESPPEEVASSVTVISADDLEKLKGSSVLDVLRNVPGVSLTQNGGPGGAASVFLRGAKSEHTLVLLDGIEINDPINPSRSADLAHFYLEDIERIEVLRGPQSPLFGSDALGGIINIITKKGKGRPRLTLVSSGGSYGTFAGQAAVSGSAKKANYSFGLSRFETKGMSAADSTLPGNAEKDGYRNVTFSGRVGLTLKENLEISLTARSIGAKTNLDNFGGPSGDDPNSFQDYRSFFFRSEIRGLFLKNRWEQKLAIGVVDSRRTLDNPVDAAHPLESESGLYKGRLLKFDWQNNFFLHPSNTLTLGIEHETEKGESDYIAQGFWGSSASFFPSKSAAMTGIYVQDHLRFADRFFVTAGARLDHHGQAGEAATYRLAQAYIFKASGTKLKASLGTAFKAPSLYQLYAPGTFFGPIGNIKLKPERSRGWDAGVEQPLFGERMQFAATYFHNDFENLINFDFALGYTNIGKAESKGLELEVEGRPNRNIFLRVSYTRLEAEDKITGAPLLRRPGHSLSASFSFSFSAKWRASASFDLVGKREDLDYWSWPSRPVTLSPYSLLNGIISNDISPHLQIFFRLDNILNQRYELVYGYGTLGLSAQIGAKISL